MIQLYNVSKTYPNQVQALKDITLHIKKGEYVFLVGPSGAGKSTLTKLICREELPTHGQVIVNGRSLPRMKSRQVPYLRRRIGMVYQDFRLIPTKTVFENVAFALEITGTSRREMRQLVPEALSMVGMEKKINMRPYQLSGGEQQRTAVARAIVNNPVLILADEPTGNLDPDTSWGLMELFKNINQLGTTILMATHAWDIVDDMKKRVIQLENGVIVRDEEGGVYANAH